MSFGSLPQAGNLDFAPVCTRVPTSGVAFLGISIPEVFLALLFILLAAKTGWFPIGGMRSVDYDSLSAAGKAPPSRACRSSFDETSSLR